MRQFESDKYHNYRDTAWKRAFTLLTMAFLEFFLPKTAKMINHALPIWCSSDYPLLPMGAPSSKGERRMDFLLKIPLLGPLASYIILFIEQQHFEDKSMVTRCKDTFMRLLNLHPGKKIGGIVICTGYANKLAYLIDKVITETSFFVFGIKTIYLSSFTLEKLENDDRLFARIMYIALLETIGGKEPERRNQTARKALEHLKRKNLSQMDMFVCCLFAWTLLRLDEVTLDSDLEKEFKMFIKDKTEMLLEISRQDGLKKGDLNARREIAMNLLELGLSTAPSPRPAGFRSRRFSPSALVRGSMRPCRSGLLQGAKGI
ncbi:MAG: hypothetical protein LBR53_10700 [Deltaproteobacteria bacterium]|jgi:hypothetical protein|nr:hypothetical protein [Deltaproteobacteria bacterium]